MPKDFYDKLTAISEATSKNKAIIILILTMLSSGSINAIQYFQGIETAFISNAMKDTITMLANTYIKDCKK